MQKFTSYSCYFGAPEFLIIENKFLRNMFYQISHILAKNWIYILEMKQDYVSKKEVWIGKQSLAHQFYEHFSHFIQEMLR